MRKKVIVASPGLRRSPGQCQPVSAVGRKAPYWNPIYERLGPGLQPSRQCYIVAAVPVFLLFYLLAVRKIIAYMAAVYAFLAATLIAWAVFGMPAHMVAGAAGAGMDPARRGLCLRNHSRNRPLRNHQGIDRWHITDDRRLQVLLIAFAFGATLEGAGGGGAPVAICGAMMVASAFILSKRRSCVSLLIQLRRPGAVSAIQFARWPPLPAFRKPISAPWSAASFRGPP